jgi:hypothetical protein
MEHVEKREYSPAGSERFQQLVALAAGSDECAVADLFHEFGFRFGEEEEVP